MNETKSILLSKTVWGVIIGVLGILLPKFGLMPLDDAAADMLAGEIVSAIGALLAIYGRIKAVKKITVT